MLAAEHPLQDYSSGSSIVLCFSMLSVLLTEAWMFAHQDFHFSATSYENMLCFSADTANKSHCPYMKSCFTMQRADFVFYDLVSICM